MKMLKTIVGALASVTALAAGVQASAQGGAQDAVIHAGAVVTDADEGLSGPSTITVRGGRIVSITEGHTGGEDAIDLSDKTVLPGLIDLHTHLSGDPSGEFWRTATTPPEYKVIEGVKNARITALAGFTTVRDVGSRTDQVMQSLRQATEIGMVPGPRIVTSGRSISIVGGHADYGNGFRRELDPALTTGYNCTGVVECTEKVRLASKYGADLIKISATGGVLSQQGRGLEAHFTDEEMRAIVETAESLGMKVAAHAHGARGIEAAARAGVQTIEHGTYLDEQAGRVMRENGTVLIPTLMAFEGIKGNLDTGYYTPVVEGKIREVSQFAGTIVERARRYGVRVAFGTDAGVFPHGENAGEFRLMMAGGFTSREALAAATTVAAEILGMEGEIGRLAAGYSADIIAVHGNPVEDATVLENVDWVMVRGRVVE